MYTSFNGFVNNLNIVYIGDLFINTIRNNNFVYVVQV